MKEILFNHDEVAVLYKALSARVDDEKVMKQRLKIYKKLERASKKIKVSSAKGKGRNLQYWVCERIGKIFNIEFNQSDDNCLIHSREMGQHGTDVIIRGKLYKKFPFDIECKSCESLSIPEWVRQARSNQKENRDWLVIFKKQTIGGEPLVLMDFSCFEKLFIKGMEK